MQLSKRRARKGDGALIIQDKPAPWNLHVKSSWVFPFLVNEAKLDSLLKSSKDKANLYTAGIGNKTPIELLGTAMIIRYGDSPAGAYDELLIALPVKTPILKKEYVAPRSIPLIYVSSEASLRNGRKNWGIRKENANFQFKESAGWLTSITSIKITDRYTGELILDASFKRYVYAI
jgi:hypothetical protein